MTAAFDTIDGNNLADIYHNISEKEKYRMIQKLLSKRKLSIEVSENISQEYFNTKIESSQDDKTSKLNFKNYLENSVGEIPHNRQDYELAQETRKVPAMNCNRLKQYSLTRRSSAIPNPNIQKGYK